jgi:hypothetical protein
LYDRGQWITASVKSGKADVVIVAEGSSPECDRASAEDTAGVEEQGMSSKGQPGNPSTSLRPGVSEKLHLDNELEERTQTKRSEQGIGGRAKETEKGKW